MHHSTAERLVLHNILGELQSCGVQLASRVGLTKLGSKDEKFHRRSKVLLQTGWRAFLSRLRMPLSIWKTMARCGLKSRDQKKL